MTVKNEQSLNYLLFAGQSYYAGGGVADFKGAFPDEESARRQLVLSDEQQKKNTPWRNEYDWAHILELSTMTVIVIRQGEYCGEIEEGPWVLED